MLDDLVPLQNKYTLLATMLSTFVSGKAGGNTYHPLGLHHLVAVKVGHFGPLQLWQKKQTLEMRDPALLLSYVGNYVVPDHKASNYFILTPLKSTQKTKRTAAL